MATRPRLVIIGGPNGAGKTTFARMAGPHWSLRYLSADLVAEDRGLGTTGRDAFEAGRVFTRTLHAAISERESLLVESTLSGRGVGHLIRRARASGYGVLVVCVFVDSAKSCIVRIRSRALKGSHVVPDDDVRRRFGRSLVNFWQRYRFDADAWHLEYNGGSEPVRVAFGNGPRAIVLDSRGFERFLELVET